MKNNFYIPPDEKVHRAFLHWLDEGKKLWEMYEQEGVSIPPTLKRTFTDINQSSDKNQVRKTPMRPPDKPASPPNANDDWIWIEPKDASVRTIVLAILNEGKPLSIKEVINRVKEIIPKSNEGTIYNLSSQEEKIQKTDQGLILKPGEEAPILYKNYIWAPKNILLKPDIAAFRRMVIRHLLATSPDGLQIMQVYRQLEDAEWLNAPLSKDLVKADLLVMKEEKVVKTMGNTKKWTLTT